MHARELFLPASVYRNSAQWCLINLALWKSSFIHRGPLPGMAKFRKQFKRISKGLCSLSFVYEKLTFDLRVTFINHSAQFVRIENLIPAVNLAEIGKDLVCWNF